MIRVLFKKEIKELFSFFMYDSKKKEKRSAKEETLNGLSH